MTKVTLYLEPAVALFYSRVADWAGLPLEQVLCDSLYKLAGELSLEKPIVISSRICYTKRERNPRRFSGVKTRHLEVPP
ncbi:MAG: hypothetical protein BHW31_08110 [Firmicutes bacterium CAG:110_56_8]|nr:MAG: hypothetical protein BHW31_08110 [Firmicutes bacterium CAG:110_56_8]